MVPFPNTAAAGMASRSVRTAVTSFPAGRIQDPPAICDMQARRADVTGRACSSWSLLARMLDRLAVPSMAAHMATAVDTKQWLCGLCIPRTGPPAVGIVMPATGGRTHWSVLWVQLENCGDGSAHLARLPSGGPLARIGLTACSTMLLTLDTLRWSAETSHQPVLDPSERHMPPSPSPVRSTVAVRTTLLLERWGAWV